MPNKLKEIRKSKGITQEDLSKLSGISRQTIITIENGKDVNVSVETLKKISKALHCKITDIFFD